MGKHVDPRKAARLAGLAAKRAMIEGSVHRLIALLDVIDAQTEDLEPDDEDTCLADWEPSLGAPERHPSPLMLVVCGFDPSPWQDQTHWSDGRNAQDREQDIADEPHDEEPDREEDADKEPSLGWTDGLNQDVVGATRFGRLGSEEPEPSLGSLMQVDQRRWSKGVNDDRERGQDPREYDWRDAR